VTYKMVKKIKRSLLALERGRLLLEDRESFREKGARTDDSAVVCYSWKGGESRCRLGKGGRRTVASTKGAGDV